MYRWIMIVGIVVGLALPAFADTAKIHSTAKADGTWWQVADGRMYWAGTFWITSFNNAGDGFDTAMTVRVLGIRAFAAKFCCKYD